MKIDSSLVAVLVAALAGVHASPAPGTTTDSSPADGGKSFPKLIGERAACYHQSDCSWFYAAKCEAYCRKWGQHVGVARMEKCSFLNNKRCCCTQ